MAKKKNELTIQGETQIDEQALLNDVTAIIENRKYQAQSKANQETVLMFWEVGQRIGSDVLGGKRAEYGKQIVVTLSQQLQIKYGSSFEYSNVTRMIKFAARFPDSKIVVTLSQQLTWSHIIALLPLKSDEAFMYYAEDSSLRHLAVRELRRQISRKAYERRENSNLQLSEQSIVPFNVFKDPYLLDVFGLKDNFLEGDLENAILRDIEAFLLEFGQGIAFVKRQKRMIIDGRDFELDLLLYSRTQRRLIAIDLKIDEFKAANKPQMELYLEWLNKNERLPGEEQPIGIILCPSASREIVEMLKVDKAGIAVAEYWTELPPKIEFEQKLREIYAENRSDWSAAKCYQAAI